MALTRFAMLVRSTVCDSPVERFAILASRALTVSVSVATDSASFLQFKQLAGGEDRLGDVGILRLSRV